MHGLTHCYERHGTTTLFAALEISTGQLLTAHLGTGAAESRILQLIRARRPGIRAHVSPPGTRDKAREFCTLIEFVQAFFSQRSI